MLLKWVKNWGVRLAVFFAGLLWLALMAASWAQAAPNAQAPAPQQAGQNVQNTQNSSDDEYSFNWLDPEKKIYVLQNRRYTKTHRLLVSAMVGPGFSNSFRNTLNVDPRLAFYMSEALGIEFFFTITKNSDSNAYKALQAANGSSGGIYPVIREIRSQYGGLIHWVPWYAKINVFNKILYFDWYFSGGVGMVHSAVGQPVNATAPIAFNDQDKFAFYAGTGHQYHLNENFTVRLDVTGAFYSAPVYVTGGDNSWFSNFNFGIGVGARL